MITIDEEKLRTLEGLWQNKALQMRQKEGNIDRFQEGLAAAYQETANEMNRLLNKSREEVQEKLQQQITQHQLRQIEVNAHKQYFRLVIFFTIPLLFALGAYDIPEVITPIYFAILIAYILILRRQIFHDTILILISIGLGIGLIIFGQWGEVSILTALREQSGNLGGEILGAALSGLLFIWMTKKFDLPNVFLILSSLVIGLGFVFFLGGVDFKGATSNLGIELLGAGVTVIMLENFLEGE